MYEKKFRDLKTIDLQNMIDHCDKNYTTLRKIKILFNQLYSYAMKTDLCEKDYSKYVNNVKYNKKNPDKYDREIFTREQIDIFWDLQDDKYYQIILILIYNELRIKELLFLKKEDIHLKKQYIEIIESKTENGISKVPISNYIYSFVENWYDFSDCDYLIHTEKQNHSNIKIIMIAILSHWWKD